MAKIAFIFWNYKINDSLLILIEKEFFLPFIEFLKKNIFSEEITFSFFDNFSLLMFFNAAKDLAKFFPMSIKKLTPNQLTTQKDAIIIRSDFTFYNDFLIIVKKEMLPKISFLKEKKNIIYDFLLEKNRWLLLQFLPKGISVLVTPFYQMTIDFEKGCYPGQEIVARFKSRQRTPLKKIVLLQLKNTYLDESLSKKIREKKKLNDRSEILHVGYSYTWQKIIILALINSQEIINLNHFILNQKKIDFTVLSLPLTEKNQKNSFKEIYNLALEYFHNSDYEKAKTAFKQAVALRPNDELALEGLSLCYEKIGNYQKAIKTNKTIIEHNPLTVMGHTNLSRLYMLLGFKEKAEEESKKATVMLFKKTAQENKAKKSEKPFHKQIEFYQKILQEEANDDIAHFQLGKIYHTSENYPLAKKHLEQAIAINQEFSLAYLLLGEILFQQKQNQKAIAILQKGLEITKKKGELEPLKKITMLLDKITANESRT